jgi:hypothetical protein
VAVLVIGIVQQMPGTRKGQLNPSLYLVRLAGLHHEKHDNEDRGDDYRDLPMATVSSEQAGLERERTWSHSYLSLGQHTAILEQQACHQNPDNSQAKVLMASGFLAGSFQTDAKTD